MGNKTNTSCGVRAVFVGLAAAAMMSTTACAKHPVMERINSATTSMIPVQQQRTLIAPTVPQRTTPTAEDFKKLDEYHAAAVASLAKRSLERCTMPLDTTRGMGPLGNLNVEKVLVFDELAKARPRMAAPTKAMLAIADRAGYAICFDKRLTGSEYASAIYINDKVISLNPVALNAEKPILLQQAALAVTLEHMINFWNKGVPEQVAQMPIAIAMHGGSYLSDFYITPWTAKNLSPAPVIDFKKPPVDPQEEKRRWMQEAYLAIPAPKFSPV